MTTSAQIDQLLTQYKCESDISILDKVFFDYGLRDYFNKLCEQYNIVFFYGSFEAFSAIKRENILRTKDLEFYKICKFTALIFEGCKHINCSYKQTQLGLLYGAFNSLGYSKFSLDVHEKVKDKNKISEEQLDELKWILPKEKFKNSCDLYMVLMDAREMFVYWCEYLDTEITDKVQAHFKKMYSIPQSMCVDYIFTQIKKTNWKTRWAKLKAFNRDFYKVTETLRIKLLNHLKVD